MTIIGVTGHPASGKDTVADYLVSKGFTKASGGDILREEMQKLGLPTDRNAIHSFVAEMRSKYGNGYLCEETIKRLNGDSVISGIRNTDEVKTFREKLGSDFRLIAVEAPLETRYMWAKERGRIGDDVSFEEFKKEEDQERAADSGSHEVDVVIKMADVILSNEGTKEDLYKKVYEFLISQRR